MYAESVNGYTLQTDYIWRAPEVGGCRGDARVARAVASVGIVGVSGFMVPPGHVFHTSNVDLGRAVELPWQKWF